jgi:mannose-1-phosphate guanylyltransferase
LAEIAKASPLHHGAFLEIVSSLKEGRTVVAEIAFRELPDISIDHALMEKSSNVGLVEAGFDWDDVGAWDALERVLENDAEGNALFGNASVMDSCGCVVHNTNEGQTVKLLGVKDLVVVVTPTAILVCPKDRAQDVKKLAGD